MRRLDPYSQVILVALLVVLLSIFGVFVIKNHLKVSKASSEAGIALNEMQVAQQLSAVDVNSSTSAALTLAAETTLSASTVSQLLQNQATSNQVTQESVRADQLLPDFQQQIITVRNNDNLVRIFKRAGLNSKEAHRIIALNKNTKLLNRLRKGEKVTLLIGNDKKFRQLTYAPNITDTLNVICDKTCNAQLKHIEPKGRLEYVATTVRGSIYSSAKQVGLPNKITAQLINIFSNKVNLKKMHNDDKIALFYKTYFVNNKKVRDGDIAIAAVTHKNIVHKLIGFAEPGGKTDYYTPEGYNTKPVFMRFPLRYKRISSLFSMHRMHPIYHFVRPHLGVDLAANIGTPVKATSDGKIAFLGRQSGYGNVIVIRHNQYSTAYGHLLKFASGLKPGNSVKQGQLIAYVGSSGLSDGPHLHYEFRINGVHHDPLKVKLPVGEMIASCYRKQFFALSKTLLAQLNMRSNTLALAQ
jgi:murein DD-endopeptidase MepM/ murein hydrolase activator NlpD